jgi:hypothetical protein
MIMTNTKKPNRKSVQKKNTGLIWLGLIAIIFAELFVYTWIRMESTHTTFRISKAKAQLSNKQSYTEALLVEREWLKSYAQLTEIAKKHFKLSPVTLDRVIYLENSNLN